MSSSATPMAPSSKTSPASASASSSSAAAAAAAAPVVMNWEDASTCMVVEVGGGNTRIGYAGEGAPQAHFPTSCGVRQGGASTTSTQFSSSNGGGGGAAAAAATASDDPRCEYFIGNEALGVRK